MELPDNNFVKPGCDINVTLVLPSQMIPLTLPYKQRNHYTKQDILNAARPHGVQNIADWRVRFAEIHEDNILFDKDIIYINYTISDLDVAKAVNGLPQDSEQLKPSSITEKRLITDERIYFNKEKLDSCKEPRDEIMQALSHATYYLSSAFHQANFPDIDVESDLPHCKITEKAPLIRTSKDIFFIDYLDEDYHIYMTKALDLYNRAHERFQSERNENHWQYSVYKPLLNLAGLHEDFDTGGLEKLQIHPELLSSYSSYTRGKFNSGLKPDITDGWLFLYKATQQLYITPDRFYLPGESTPAAKFDYQLGDDAFLWIDFLMELKKNETDEDKFKIMLEADGCLECFKPIVPHPKVFFGTGNRAQARFYFIRKFSAADLPASEPSSSSEETSQSVSQNSTMGSELRRPGSRSRSRSQPKDTRPDKKKSGEQKSDDKKKSGEQKSDDKKKSGEHNSESTDSTESRKTEPWRSVVQEIFSASLETLDAFLQTAAFLWRLKLYRRRQFRRWFGLTYQSDQYLMNLVIRMRNYNLDSNNKNNQRTGKIPPSPTKSRNNPFGNAGQQSNTNQLAGTVQKTLENFLGQRSLAFNFTPQELLDDVPEKREVWRGVFGADQQPAVLKIGRGEPDANELMTYQYLLENGFTHIPRIHQHYKEDKWCAILMEWLDFPHLQLVSAQQITEFAYHLLTVLARLHSLNVIHGDIKEENMLYNVNADNSADNKLILIDFGFSHIVEDYSAAKPMLGCTKPYISDEAVVTDAISCADDIYNAGIILAAMVCAVKARNIKINIFKAMREIQVNEAPLCNSGLKEVILEMLKPLREDRPKAVKLLEKPVFNSLALINTQQGSAMQQGRHGNNSRI